VASVNCQLHASSKIIGLYHRATIVTAGSVLYSRLKCVCHWILCKYLDQSFRLDTDCCRVILPSPLLIFSTQWLDLLNLVPYGLVDCSQTFNYSIPLENTLRPVAKLYYLVTESLPYAVILPIPLPESRRDIFGGLVCSYTVYTSYVHGVFTVCEKGAR